MHERFEKRIERTERASSCLRPPEARRGWKVSHRVGKLLGQTPARPARFKHRSSPTRKAGDAEVGEDRNPGKTGRALSEAVPAAEQRARLERGRTLAGVHQLTEAEGAFAFTKRPEFASGVAPETATRPKRMCWSGFPGVYFCFIYVCGKPWHNGARARGWAMSRGRCWMRSPSGHVDVVLPTRAGPGTAQTVHRPGQREAPEASAAPPESTPSNPLESWPM